MSDYRAVRKADINLNGITVIAGENGCGKTTTTRWIYYLLEIISNFEEYAFADYKNALRHVVNKLDAIRREVGFYSDMDKMPNISRLRSRIMNLQNESQDEIAAFTLLFEEATIKLAEVLKTYFDSPKDLSRKQRLLANLDIFGGKETFDSEVFVSAMLAQINECYDKYNEVYSRRYNVHMWSTLHKYFDEKLTIPKYIRFVEDGVEIIGNKQFGHSFGISRCIYVDTPMALARMQDTDNIFWQRLRKMMFTKREGQLTIEVRRMIHRIRKIINGAIVVDPDSIDDDELRFVREDDGLNIPIEETATGLKSFAYILRLLENGLLDDRTLMIIDEPEVHLHPQWIVEFANLLVELHKEIGLRILVASHNPDFVSAVHSISENKGIIDDLSFYLAEVDDSNKFVYNYRDLGANIGPIFESFNIALSRIELYGGRGAGI